MMGYLFESKSEKYLELVRGDTRFHKNRDHATIVDKSEFDDRNRLAQLLDHHNADWYLRTVQFHPQELPMETEFDLTFKVACGRESSTDQYDEVAAAVEETSFFDSTTLSRNDGRFTLSVALPGENAAVLAKVAGELSALLPSMQITGIEFWQRDVGSG